MHIVRWVWESVANLGLFWRFSIKAFGMIGFILIVLFPNPVLFIRQLGVYSNLDTLIQTDFEGIEQINREIDALLPANATREQELKAIQRYVYQQITYTYDWENWLNADYWPTAAEVWQRKREDCDGQAVLVTSILRSRGVASARLAGNIRHIWVTFEHGALMGPESEQTIQQENGQVRVVWPSWELLLGSLAIGIAEFQTYRTLLLYFGVLLICYHPCRLRAGFFKLSTLGLIGFIFLKDWAEMVLETREVSMNAAFWGGGIALLSSIVLAVGMHVVVKHDH